MIEVPFPPDQSVMTDWAELCCLFGADPSLSRPEVQKILEEAEMGESEIFVENIWQEIGRRQTLIDQCYPFNMTAGRLEKARRWEEALGYSFQLLVSSSYLFDSTTIKNPEWRKVSKLFEKFTTYSIGQYLAGEALNIGFPRENGIPGGFRECLDLVCQQTREERGTGGKDKWLSLPNAKDRGVDIIAWRGFPDKRPGQIIIIAQCAAGYKWRDKIKEREINPTIWNTFIDWKVKPLVAYAFPFVCSTADWNSLSLESEYGLLLDRLRLATLFCAGSPTATFISELEDWCRSQARRLPDL